MCNLSNGFFPVFAYFYCPMEVLKDILVNLVSDAVWAIGGLAFAYFSFSSGSDLPSKKIAKSNLYNYFSTTVLAFKKSAIHFSN